MNNKIRLRISIAGLSFILLGSCSTIHIDNPDISINELNEHIAFLASDSLKGRLPGSPEDKVAAEYILDQFMDFGLQPMDSNGLQYYRVVTHVSAGEGNSLQTEDFQAEFKQDFSPFSFSENSSLTSRVVFAGYGFQINQEELKWDDYQDIDVSGKWVLILRGDPEIDSLQSPYIAYSEDRDKVMQAKDLGAGGVLLVSGSGYDPSDNLTDLETRSSSAGIPVFQITRKFADRMLQQAGESVDKLEKDLNNLRRARSFNLEIEVTGRSEIILESVETYNVVALLEGGNSVYPTEYLVIGAHFDHLGMGGLGSTSRIQDTTGIHHGADDNASGVATIIELAEKFAAQKDSLKRNILFVAFGAEEMGLLGSKHFVENPPVNLSGIKMMLNIDMVGRLTSERNLQVGGVGTSLESREILNMFAKDKPFGLVTTEEGYGPSDHASFYGREIPVLFFSTGAHLDYHTPDDVIENINFEGLKSIGDYIYQVANEITSREVALTFREAGPKTGSQVRRRKGVSLGIMPDFAGNEKNGLRADFVIEGKPAYKGGMKKGDIIVAINGKPVKNIHDYMYRLSKLKFGETINVEIRRGEKSEVLLIQL